MGKGHIVEDVVGNQNVGYEINIHRLNAYDDFVTAWVLSPRQRNSQRKRILLNLFAQLTPYIEEKDREELDTMADEMREFNERSNLIEDVKRFTQMLFNFKVKLNDVQNRMNLFLEQQYEEIFTSGP